MLTFSASNSAGSTLRPEPSSNVDYSGPLKEVVAMGNCAVLLLGLKRILLWDGENIRITNVGEKDEIRVVTTDRFEIVDGNPRFCTEYATVNAKETAEEYIKRTYREGWGY